MPVILATQEAEIRRLEVQSHPGQIVQEFLSQKKGKNKIKIKIYLPKKKKRVPISKRAFKKERIGGVTQV
jgi:hypothetical protein